MSVPFNDLRPALAPIRHDIDAEIRCVLDSGVFLNGEHVEKFQEEFAHYCGHRHCIACASGTDAITLTALAFGWEWFSLAGNGCVFTNAGLIRGAMTPDPAGNVQIIDVNERGRPLYRDHYGLVDVLLYGRYPTHRVTEFVDACQAHGWKPPRHAACCWSGYPTKNLGAFGDCGWITTDSDSFAQTIRDIKADPMVLRGHSRMSEIDAAVLRVKLKCLDEWNSERARLAEIYWNELPEWCDPVCRPGEPSNHHLFAVLVERRDELEKHLKEREIGCAVHYREPLADLPGCVDWRRKCLSLPIWVGMKDEQVKEVCDAIKGFK